MIYINGFANEYNFVLELNNKKVGELNILLRELIYSIYNNINDDMIIKAWRNHYKQKSDIIIKIGNAIKGISIKMGTRNSVHAEPINKFISFLRNNKIDEMVIEEYKKYHYADGTIDGSGINRQSKEEYSKNHKKILII